MASNGNYVVGRVMSNNGVDAVESGLSLCRANGADRTLDTRHVYTNEDLRDKSDIFESSLFEIFL